MQVCYVNCIRILLQHGANPNCSYRSNLTPLYVLIFTVGENLTLNCESQKQSNFDFIKNILLLLLQHGLDCNTVSSITKTNKITLNRNLNTFPKSFSVSVKCRVHISIYCNQQWIWYKIYVLVRICYQYTNWH